MVADRGETDGSVFGEFHGDARLGARKRLYMTATRRLYTERSKSKLAEYGIVVDDMGDSEIYGPERHRLPFTRTVGHKMLSGYSKLHVTIKAKDG